ncbi:MAG: hypothetical protein H7067_14115, partial [Burkholderiales bacterium]|nr:hypothetical protein [Opitutaceae bacterium]
MFSSYPSFATPAFLFRVLVALLFSCDTAFAADLYVAPDGVNDTTAGRGQSLGNPYRTIDYAADRATPGATVHIRAGTYRETVTPAISGTANAPIIFKPYDNEVVTISGLNLITPGSNSAGTWELDTDSVYKIQLTSGYGSDSGFSLDRITGCQVFVDGEGMAQARWPNAPTPMGINRIHAATAVTGSYVATGTAGSLIYAGTYQHPGLDAFAADAWKNGLIVFAPGAQWYRRASPIDGNTPAGATSEVR